MILLSHGKDSNLLEHLLEVSAAALNLEERVICACHDAAKATISWQSYIRDTQVESPHRHAASGGLLAALLLQRHNGDHAAFWTLVALHSGAAHHSVLGLCQQCKNEFCTVADDSQAAAFFQDRDNGIPALLPEFPLSHFRETWAEFRRMAPMPNPVVTEFNRRLEEVAGEERIRAFLASRSILGRMCFQDHLSAARQSGKKTEVENWQQAYPPNDFVARSPRYYPDSTQTIHRLRRELKTAFLNVMSVDSPFYFIDAPTGLGKTETMLSSAEQLLEQHGLSRIVFSVPQVAIADQIFADYFDVNDRAQIWNYLRQEKKAVSDAPDDNLTPEFAVDAAVQPFGESYNITTFNQVLLAMCHPHRNRCIRGIGLRDAVIIMDEFHKLPMTILPYFFRIAREYARLYRCRFIFGSATPLEECEYLGLAHAGRIPVSTTSAIYREPVIDDRRHYLSLGRLTRQLLLQHIIDFHSDSEQNLLVVLNLIAEGTWPLLRHFQSNYNPWQQLADLQGSGSSRLVVVLDGLVPPMLRRQLVIACREAMCRRPVTLITTQMVEVGVDLDFDHAIIDYQGLAATIQRGGRVGREGRDKPCIVEVFSLLTEAGKTSFEVLDQVQKESDIRFRDSRFQDIADKEATFHRREFRFFEQWDSRIFRDSDLIAELLTIQRRVFGDQPSIIRPERFFCRRDGRRGIGNGFPRRTIYRRVVYRRMWQRFIDYGKSWRLGVSGKYDSATP